MRSTGVSNAFVVRATGDATTAFELVPEGNRVKLFSVIWHPYTEEDTSVGQDNSSTIKLTNGQSGSALYESGFWAQNPDASAGAWINFPSPSSYLPIPSNGILFGNGIWCQGVKNHTGGSGGGVLAVSITYQGCD